MSGIPHHMDLHPGRNIYLTSCFILSVLFWQILICLLSLHLSGFPNHMDLHPGRNVYLTSWFILSVLFLTGGETSVVPTCVWNSPCHGLPPWLETYTWPAGSFCLCCFWQIVRCLSSLHLSGIPDHMDLHPGRNIYLTSWVILSVLFLTGGETSVVPTCIRDPASQEPPPWYEGLPNQLVHSVCVVFDRQWDITRTSTLAGMSTWPADSFCLCCLWQVVRRLWSLHKSRFPITLISTLVETSTWPASSFCLGCFWQAVKHLWSLHMSRIPHHTDLHPGRNVYLTS